MEEVDLHIRCRIIFVSETGSAIMCNREQMQKHDVCEEHHEVMKLAKEGQTKWIKWSFPDE